MKYFWFIFILLMIAAMGCSGGGSSGHEEDSTKFYDDSKELCRLLDIQWHELESGFLACSCGETFPNGGQGIAHAAQRNPHFDLPTGKHKLADIMTTRDDWPEFAEFINASPDEGIPEVYFEEGTLLMDMALEFLRTR